MKPLITFDQFLALDLRVGTIRSASLPDWSSKLLQFEVDFGPAIGMRTIFSGVRKWYQPEDFIGKQFGFLLNLPPKKMGNSESQGMMLMVDPIAATTSEEETVAAQAAPILLPLTTPAPDGSLIR
jgi:methionyl-tRNA synthetase